MTHLTGHDRSHLLLLPEAVDDYVGPDNPVRFIDAFVDGLDLAAASFSGVGPKVMGRPGYARRFAEALHLRLPQPGAVEPPTRAIDAVTEDVGVPRRHRARNQVRS
jgi:hypothetical protein